MRRIYTFVFFRELILATFWGCWVANFIDQGVSLNQACLDLGILLLAMALFEIPTGLFADRYGRKLSSLIGIASVSLGFFLNYFTTFGPHFVWLSYVGFVLAGLGITLISGANVAWFLNLAKSKDPQFKQDHFFLSIDLVGRLATISGAFLGVKLTLVNPSFMWIAIGAAGLIAFGIGLGIEEIKRDFHSTSHPSENIRRSITRTLMNPIVWAILASSLFFGLEAGIRNMIYQPYVVGLNHGNLMALAFFQSTLAMSRLLGNLTYRFYLSKLNRGVGFICMALFLFAAAEGIAALTHSYVVFLFPYVAAIFSLGWYFPIRDSFLNHQISEQSRATLLSADSMVNSVASGVACIVLSMVISHTNIQSFWGFGCLALSFSAISFGACSRTSRQVLGELNKSATTPIKS